MTKTMSKAANGKRRPSVHITMNRAARLHRLVMILSEAQQTRETLLERLDIGLRTFYRELELLKRCGVRIKLAQRNYVLQTSAEAAEGKLPFPDPQLSFAEMAELAQGGSPAAKRLSELLANVTSKEAWNGKRASRPKTRKAAIHSRDHAEKPKLQSR